MDDSTTSAIDDQAPCKPSDIDPPVATPRSAAAPAARQQIKLSCPACGGSAMVAWNRLDGHFFCRRCMQWYRVDKRGLVPCQPPDAVQVKVRGSFSEWESAAVSFSRLGASQAKAAMGPASARRKQKRIRLAALAGAALLLIAGVAWGLKAGGAAEEKADQPMPESLEGRATVFADAWLSHDLPKLLQLSPTTQDRTLRRWLAKHVPPGDGPTDWKVESVSVVPVNEQSADVSIRIAPSSGSSLEPITLGQRWLNQGGAWRFSPPAR